MVGLEESAEKRGLRYCGYLHQEGHGGLVEIVDGRDVLCGVLGTEDFCPLLIHSNLKYGGWNQYESVGS